MAKEIYTERRKRSFFGWLLLVVFIGWNILMIIWVFNAGASTNNAITTAATDAEKAGATTGTGIGIILILIIWGVGSVITGLLAFLTRGSTTTIVRES